MLNKNALLLVPVVMTLAACGSIQGEAKYPTGADRSSVGDNKIYDEPAGVFDSSGMDLFGGKKRDAGESGVAVNGYLWRAALDTVSFMPLASADPFGGTIITDWYTAPENQKERTKLNVFILDKQMKAEAISVKVFRQVKVGNGWKDAPVAKETATKMEDAILTRAREMRVAKEGE